MAASPCWDQLMAVEEALVVAEAAEASVVVGPVEAFPEAAYHRHLDQAYP